MRALVMDSESQLARPIEVATMSYDSDLLSDNSNIAGICIFDVTDSMWIIPGVSEPVYTEYATTLYDTDKVSLVFAGLCYYVDEDGETIEELRSKYGSGKTAYDALTSTLK